MAGLRRRLFLLVVIAIVAALAFVFHYANEDRDMRVARIQQDADRVVEIAASRQARFIDSARQLLTVLSEVPDVRGSDPAACRRFLKNLARRNSAYANLGVVGADGNLSCSALEFSGAVSLADRAYFLRAANSKSFAIGNYQAGKVTGKGSVNFGYPILDRSGEVAAVVFAALDLAWLTQLNAQTQLPAGASLSILDSEGTILARFPEPEKWTGKPAPDAPAFQILQLQSQATKKLPGADGIKRLYAFTTLAGEAKAGQIYVVVGIPEDIAFAAVHRALLKNLAWLGAAFLLAVVTAGFIGNRYVVAYVGEQARAKKARLDLASIVESSEDAIIGKSLDGTITSWNDGAEVIYGYTAQEVSGRSFTILNPPDRPDALPQLLDIIKHGKSVNRYETEHIRKDGRRLYVTASVSPIRDHHGNVVGMSTIARDITGVRRADELLRARATQLETLYLVAQEAGGTLASEEVIQRALTWVLAASGFDLAVTHFSKELSGRKCFGVGAEATSPEELAELLGRMGDGFEQSLLNYERPRFVEDTAVEADLALAATRCGIKALAVLPLSSSAQFRAALTLMSPRTHPFGAEERQFLQALSHQIGLAIQNAWLYESAIQTNKELQVEIEERQRAEKSLAEFTAMLVHDLRSPLSNVVSIAESVADGLFGPLNDEQSKWLWKVRNNCKGLIEHVSDFLDLSKIEAGRIELAKRPVDLEALLHEGLADFSLQADKRNILIMIKIDSHLPLISLDSRGINQVLSNLFSNALKFCDSGGQIEVGARRREKGEVQVWVRDSGVGIPRDEIEHVFEKYRQLSGGKASQDKGTGLGLVICKAIVEAHGGRIWVESAEGAGSTFYFTLPVSGEAASDLTLA